MHGARLYVNLSRQMFTNNLALENSIDQKRHMRRFVDMRGAVALSKHDLKNIRPICPAGQIRRLEFEYFFSEAFEDMVIVKFSRIRHQVLKKNTKNNYI